MDVGDLIAERFLIERFAGSGGMATVFRAIDNTNNERVALKVLRKPKGRDGERFAHEATMLARLQHPNIVRYIAHGHTAGGEPFLAMQWLDGESLAEALTRAAFKIDEALQFGEVAGTALGYAHANGLVHRDVKPSNLYVLNRDFSQVCLLDFGIARQRDNPSGLTSRGTIVGTPSYMAPEQARGSLDIDGRADVFALGCILFRGLTGRQPFEGAHRMAVLAKIVFESAPHVSELRPDVPRALDDLVDRMLAKDPADRPPDGEAVAAELRALDARRSGVSRTPPSVAKATALTAGEQRYVSVVAAVPGRGPSARGALSGDTVDDGLEVDGAAWEDLRSASTTLGAQLTGLADGSVIAVVPAIGNAADQAMRAARSAFMMREQLGDVSVAMATGRVLATGVTPTGEVIDRAVRTARTAAAERAPDAVDGLPIRVDDVTAGLLDARFAMGGDAAGLFLLCEREQSAATRTLLGRPSPCVGRDDELNALANALVACIADSRATAVLMTAEAGVGKSRVRYEFLRQVWSRNDAPDVWLARGDAFSSGSPYGVIAQAVRGAAFIVEGDSLDVRRKKLRARLGRALAGSELDRVCDFLGEIASVAFDDAESPQLRAARADPKLMSDQILRAWENFLVAECATRPVLLVIEDLHCADISSLRLIEAAVARLATRPFMVLGIGRPSIEMQFPSTAASGSWTRMRMPALDESACENLVEAMLGPSADAQMVSRIVERSAGNAFYLEELIRAVAEGRGDALPETVIAMAQARLDDLDVDARRVLRAASVFGVAFWTAGVAALLRGVDSSAVTASLDDLARREFISARLETRLAGQHEFAFRQGLYREAAYAMLTDADRTLGHRLAADWLKAVGETDALALADHFERGEESAKAAAFYAISAEQALGGNDLAAVLTRARRGIACGATGPTLGLLFRLQAEAHDWRGELVEAEQYGYDAMRNLPVGSPRWCEAAGTAVTAAVKLGHVDHLRAVGEELRALLAYGNISGPRLVAISRTSTALLHAGVHETAMALIMRLEQASQSTIAQEPAVAARIHTARASRSLFDGDPGGYLASTLQAVAEFERAGDRHNVRVQLGNAGHAAVQLGAYARAEEYFSEALASARRAGVARVDSIKHNLAMALALSGRVADGYAMVDAAAESSRQHGDLRFESSSRGYQSRIALLGGNALRAEQHAREAEHAGKNFPSLRAYAMTGLAAALVHAGRFVEALEAARDALKHFESASVEEGEVLARLAQAEALRALGRTDAACEAIELARDRLLERSARITDSAWRQSFLERVPENVRTLALAQEWLGESDD